MFSVILHTKALLESCDISKTNVFIYDPAWVNSLHYFLLQTGDQRVKTEKNLDIKPPMLTVTNRESAIMRLSNRLKVLEQNVSLSSRFVSFTCQLVQMNSHCRKNMYYCKNGILLVSSNLSGLKQKPF